MKNNPRGSVRAECMALLLAGSMAVLAAFSMAQPTGKKLQEKEQTSAEKFKNIKVLKTLPAKELIPVMRKFNAALGVKCEFCHVEGPNHTGFEKDDKPAKNMARKMILLTQNLNKHERVLGGQATCFMCHNGHPEPITRAPAEERRN